MKYSTKGLAPKKEPVKKKKETATKIVVNRAILKKGKMFESYPDLARQMGWKVYKNGSNSQKAQLKALSSVCLWTYDLDENGNKKSNRIIILEVYEVEKPKEDKRKTGNHTIMKRLICKSLLEFIKNSNQVSEDNNGIGKTICIGINDLYLSLGLVNKSYFEGKRKQAELSERFNSPIEHIKDFYSLVHRNMSYTLKEALKMLEDNRYARHRYTRRLMFKAEDLGNGLEVARNSMYANDEQLMFIFRAERIILNKYNLCNINDLQYRGASFRDKFYGDVITLINETAPDNNVSLLPLKYLSFYYNAVELSYFEDFIPQAIEHYGKLSEEERLCVEAYIEREFSEEALTCSDDLAECINVIHADKITTNAEKRHRSAKKNPKTLDLLYKRESEDYGENAKSFTKAVIDKKSPINLKEAKSKLTTRAS